MVHPDEINQTLSAEDRATATAAEREIDDILRREYMDSMTPIRVYLTAERRWNPRVLITICRRYQAGGWEVTREHDQRSGTNALVFKESGGRWIAGPRPPARRTGFVE